MAKLRAPIKQLLDDRLPEVMVQRIWRELQPAPKRERLPLWAAAAAVLLGLAGWAGWRAFEQVRGPDPLALRGAAADTLAPANVLGGATASVWRLDDGSQITLAEASRLQVVANGHGAFVARLERGRGRFDVRPGGPRRWRIDCGELSVEVVGTSFSVARSARLVSVAVNHGIVL
ncbi:MAG TPA: FecR family protein, partial [Polyangiales bacterium]|nr:FecR family protein [Polyangiales bacterium]